MRQADARTIRFVRALLPHGEAIGRDGNFIGRGIDGHTTRLPAKAVARLIGEGILAGDASACHAGPEARLWLKRQALRGETLAAQHRLEVRRPDGTVVNLEESPLARLAVGQRGEAEPFLAPHQVEAGERLRRLAERAQMQARVTMSYDPTRTASMPGGRPQEPAQAAIDARRELSRLIEALPRDCAGVLLDVCAFSKGLQLIETERGWPRRSAKLVLRIGLEQAAHHWGLSGTAVGPARGRGRAWMGAGGRPTELG